MWAAIHTSEAAAAACAQLDIPAPSLLDDARLSIRDPRVLGLTYTHWHAHISSGVSSVKNAWLPQAEWTSVTARTCVTSMNLQRNFLPMISPATLHPLASSITTLLLDHNPIACFPLNMRSCTAMTLLSCCHARLAYVPALPPNLLSLRLHDNRLLQVRAFFLFEKYIAQNLQLLQMPDDISHLKLLKEARLYNNQIAAVFKSSSLIAQSSSGGNIRILRMINNHVTTPLLSVIATGCPNLEDLALSHNRISSLDGPVCSLSRLQRLLLHCNRISHISGDISGASSLETLILTENRLCFLPPQLALCSKLRVRRNLCINRFCLISCRSCHLKATRCSFLPCLLPGGFSWCYSFCLRICINACNRATRCPRSWLLAMEQVETAHGSWPRAKRLVPMDALL